MLLNMIRPRVVLLLVLVASLGSVANRAQAEPVFIGGLSFMFDLNGPTPGPTATNESIVIAPAYALAFIKNVGEPDFGLVDPHLTIDLTSYVDDGDTLTLSDAVFDVDTDGDTINDGTITLSFSPATFLTTPTNPGIIGAGNIRAFITAASTTLPGVSVSQFKGGSIQLLVTGGKITPGTGISGGGSVAYAANSAPTIAITISTPEPASVVLGVMGMIGAMGLCYRLRRA